MQSSILENRHIVECSCGSYDHLFIFDFDKEYELVQIGFHYKKLSLWNRIKDCFNYLFKSGELFIEEIIIHSEDIEQIELLISALKKERAASIRMIGSAHGN